MKVELEVIKEAIELIEKYPKDQNVIKEQIIIIKKIAREL